MLSYSWALSPSGVLRWSNPYSFGQSMGALVVEGVDASAKKIYGLVNYKVVSPTFSKTLSVAAGQSEAATLDVAFGNQMGMPGMASVWSFYGDTASVPGWASMSTAGVLSVQPTAGAASGVYRFYVGSAPVAGMYPSVLGSVDVTVSGGSAVLLNGAVVTRGSTQLRVNSTEGLYVGMPVSGSGIPGGAKITALNGTTGVTLSTAATVKPDRRRRSRSRGTCSLRLERREPHSWI